MHNVNIKESGAIKFVTTLWVEWALECSDTFITIIPVMGIKSCESIQHYFLEIKEKQWGGNVTWPNWTYFEHYTFPCYEENLINGYMSLIICKLLQRGRGTLQHSASAEFPQQDTIKGGFKEDLPLSVLCFAEQSQRTIPCWAFSQNFGGGSLVHSHPHPSSHQAELPDGISPRSCFCQWFWALWQSSMVWVSRGKAACPRLDEDSKFSEGFGTAQRTPGDPQTFVQGPRQGCLLWDTKNDRNTPKCRDRKLQMCLIHF